MAALAAGPAHTISANPAGRRLIASGSDSPTPAGFRAGLSEFERLPFDGTLIRPTRRLADGTDHAADGAFSRDPWQPAEMDPMVTELKETKPGRARENFLLVLAQPGGVDWFDDAGWRETVDHWRLLARSAKQGGLRGLAFDPGRVEDAVRPFDYGRQSLVAEKDFAAYAEMARERGREVMLAVATEFPEALIVCRGMYSPFLPLLAGDAAPGNLLPAHPLGLLPAFFDGWWDAATPKIQLIDGNAATDAPAEGDNGFDRAYTRLRTQSARLAAPEHRAKLRAQLLVSQSVLLEVPPENAKPADPPESRLAARAAGALRASDGWLWIHGEAGRWWPSTSEAAPPAWPDVFPGVTAALTRVRTPTAAARDRLAMASPAENRLANGDFSQPGKEGLPKSWWTWQREDSLGTARREAPVTDAIQPATALWQGAAEARFGQELAVKAGESYVLGTRVKLIGRGMGLLKVGWKDSKGQWTSPDSTVMVPPEGAPDSDGWHHLAAIVRVPPGASHLVFMLGAEGQSTSEDRVAFAQAMAVRL